MEPHGLYRSVRDAQLLSGFLVRASVKEFEFYHGERPRVELTQFFQSLVQGEKRILVANNAMV